MTLKLLPTTAQDLQEIIEWEHHPDNSPFIGSYSLERHQEVIKDPNERHFKFINDQNSMIGYAILAGLKQENHLYELRRLVIAEKGKGYGRQSIKLIKRYCFKEAGCQRLWLDVYDFNRRARGLYLSEGFSEDGIIFHETKDGKDPKRLIIMSIIRQDLKHQTANAL